MAIMSLSVFKHKVSDDNHDEPSVHGSKKVYGMRQDYLLPFPEQEREVRGFAFMGGGGVMGGGFGGGGGWKTLVGVAVGPVQGCFDTNDETGEGGDDSSEEEEMGRRKEGRRPVQEKRWRLMMLYQDMRVLTYEISRVRKKGEGPGLAELVV